MRSRHHFKPLPNDPYSILIPSLYHAFHFALVAAPALTRGIFSIFSTFSFLPFSMRDLAPCRRYTHPDTLRNNALSLHTQEKHLETRIPGNTCDPCDRSSNLTIPSHNLPSFLPALLHYTIRPSCQFSALALAFLSYTRYHPSTHCRRLVRSRHASINSETTAWQTAAAAS